VQAVAAPEPVVDLEAVLEQAAAPTSAGEHEAVTLDFDAVMNSIDLSSTDAKLEASQSPVAGQPAVAPPIVAEKPVEAPAAAPAPAAAAEAASTPGSYGSSRKTVMIVDDSPTIRKILGLTLERAGYKVVAEPDGESAIERLIQVVPDLILLDIAMPKIDGYEVCKRIKQDPRTKHVPVVMLSGKGALFDKVKGHMAGATEYLTKPFETPAVLAVVANYCEKTAEVVNG
jgi:CheY-like chemotaxis protein